MDQANTTTSIVFRRIRKALGSKLLAWFGIPFIQEEASRHGIAKSSAHCLKFWILGIY